MGGAKSILGKYDPNATNTIDSTGNIVATGTPGGQVVKDPNGGLNTSQRLFRGMLSGVGQKLQQGPQVPTSGGGAPIVTPPQPELGPSAYGQAMGNGSMMPWANMKFFYGGN